MLAALPVSAQLISNIRHEPFGEKVIITYSLNGLAPQQRLEVKVYCSDDKFSLPLRSVSGNGAGQNVAGNGQKTIVWDVLKDKDKLQGPISFEIRALVFEDNTSTANSGTVTAVPLTLDQQKSAAYAQISGTLGRFIIEAADLVITFQSVDQSIFDDPVALRAVTDAIYQYNEAFLTLSNERMSYEKEVLTLWNNEALYNDVRYLFDYALGELHNINVLELNRALEGINNINTGKISGRKEVKAARDQVLANIAQNTAQLDKRVKELERRSSRILYTLSER
jgi:hypothetical protein